MTAKPIRLVAGPMHKCACRCIVPVSRSSVRECVCGERYLWAENPPAKKIIVIGEEESAKEKYETL